MGKNSSPDFKNTVSLSVNDTDIGLNEFADYIVKETILGMLNALNTGDFEEIKNVKIEISNEE
ncbi:hypothetical protein [Methanobrevibacter sp.]|uniref:hypothetical protein n=1 Tax=Methanobrevibacter sp. TaxID=66852 RepID=UPI00388F1BA5